MYHYRQDINQKYINRLLSLICPEVLMLLVDVVKKKIYLHLKHLHLSCVRSRQFSPEHIKYRNRKPADPLTGLYLLYSTVGVGRSEATNISKGREVIWWC